MTLVPSFRNLSLLGALALAAGASPAFAQAPTLVPIPPVPTLVTSGQAEAKVTPDRATVLVAVQTRASNAAAAGTDNATRIQNVLDALAKLGLTKDQLTTEGYSVNPEMSYDRAGGAPRVTGYVVTNMVKAETRRLDQVGAIIDAALSAGATMIHGLSFHASSIEEPRRAAIGQAVANARADAEAMARAAGGSLGTLIELSTQGPTMPPRPMYQVQMRGAVASSVEAPTPINPGQQTITVYVNARWQFVPNR